MEREIWGADEREPYAPLRGRRTSDAVVIGGGLSGLTTALWLCKAGLRVSLLEAARLGGGASRHCAGIVSLSHGMRFDALRLRRGVEIADAYAKTRQSAFAALRTLCTEADWQDADAQLVASGISDDALDAEAEAARHAGIALSVAKPTQCPFPAENALLLRDMGTLDPAKYMKSLRRQAEKLGLKIYENSRVTAIETNLAYTQRGSVLAPYLIIATGYPIVNVPGWYFLWLVQRQSCLLRLSGSATFKDVYLDANGRYALRRFGEGALLQLNGGRVGEKVRVPILQAYRESYSAYLNGLEPTSVASGVETYAPDGLPYIGAYSKKTPNLFVASGYGGQGLLGSMTAAQAISALILGLPSDAYSVYAGDRGSAKSNVKAALGTGARYLKSHLAFRAPKCPHMGCKLRYNRGAKLWECPCHGSRFDDIGHIVNAPATRDAEIDRR